MQSRRYCQEKVGVLISGHLTNSTLNSFALAPRKQVFLVDKYCEKVDKSKDNGKPTVTAQTSEIAF